MDDTLADTPNAHDLFLFLAATAHDMKNSISILSGTLERLLVSNAPEEQEQLVRIRRVGQRVVHLQPFKVRMLPSANYTCD